MPAAGRGVRAAAGRHGRGDGAVRAGGAAGGDEAGPAGPAAAGGGGDRQPARGAAQGGRRGRRGGGVGGHAGLRGGEDGGGEAGPPVRLRDVPAAHAAVAAPPADRPFPAGADIPALWDWDRDSINLLFGAAVNNDRARLGLPEVDDVRDYVITDRPLLAADPVLSPWREAELQVVQTGAWLLPDDRPLPADLARFLDDGEPPVYVGFGSMPMHQATDLGEVVVEAVRRHGRRMVLSRGWADLESAGDDCFVTGEANHQALFRRSAAVVHHGGAGTTVTAAWAGTPQVVVPQGADQPHWASRVAELGIGAAHDGPAPTVESLADALGTALASKKRAAAIAATIPTDGAATAAQIVLG
ncbi:hypothetical protein KUTG_08721 [Kutzneria sp. 744]|nr:hypothetical protein KUTG_08721 [Kutzneria sp. 744]